MLLEVEATYDDGVLKPDQHLPLTKGQRVRLTISSPGGRAKGSAGLIPWNGDPKELEHLLGPDNQPWANE
jgi:predicted DNA-binding antitoxin AbrB/MazE fold protein